MIPKKQNVATEKFLEDSKKIWRNWRSCQQSDVGSKSCSVCQLTQIDRTCLVDAYGTRLSRKAFAKSIAKLEIDTAGSNGRNNRRQRRSGVDISRRYIQGAEGSREVLQRSHIARTKRGAGLQRNDKNNRIGSNISITTIHLLSMSFLCFCLSISLSVSLCLSFE